MLIERERSVCVAGLLFCNVSGKLLKGDTLNEMRRICLFFFACVVILAHRNIVGSEFLGQDNTQCHGYTYKY